MSSRVNLDKIAVGHLQILVPYDFRELFVCHDFDWRHLQNCYFQLTLVVVVAAAAVVVTAADDADAAVVVVVVWRILVIDWFDSMKCFYVQKKF